METVEASGATFTVRPIEARDQAALVRFYAGLSDDSREARFHGAMRGIGTGLASALCHPDHQHDEGVVAESDDGLDGKTLIGHLCLEPDPNGDVEMAVAVADGWRRRGVGRAMLLAAIAWARSRGAERLVASVRCGNGAMIGLVRSLGLPVAIRSSGAELAMRVDLGQADCPAA
jgi:acetyltransferase